jgi:uncharacterized protein (TIGR03437 family)
MNICGCRSIPRGNLYFADTGNDPIRMIGNVNGDPQIALSNAGFGGYFNINASGVPQGFYTGYVQISASGASNSPRYVRVTLNVGGPQVSDITNSASFVQGLAPGAILSIFGTGLTTNVSGVVSAGSLPLPTSLMGTSVLIDGTQYAPLFAVASINGLDQINFQMPLNPVFPIFPRSYSFVIVNNNGQTNRISGYFTPAQAAMPGVFMWDGSTAIIQHGLTGELVTPANPATKGEVVVMYADGLGAVNPSPDPRSPSGSSPVSMATLSQVVTVGGIGANVSFAGLTPTLVGLYQVNFQVPTKVPSGSAVSVTLQGNGIASQPTQMAIQ